MLALRVAKGLRSRRLHVFTFVAIALFQAGPSSALLQQPVSPQQELAAATTADHAGQYEKAARGYERFLSSQPGSLSPAVIEVRVRLATVYFLLHRYAESLTALNSLSWDSVPAPNPPHSRPIPAQAWIVRGLDCLELNQPVEAIRSLRQALELSPSSGTARLALGDALARSGRLEEAAVQYHEQLRRSPGVADAWYKLGMVYTELAQRTSDSFIERQPHNPLALELVSEQLADRGDSAGAARTLYQAIHPLGAAASATVFVPGLHADLGTALLELGDPSAAENEFTAEISQDSESLPALLGLVQCDALRQNWGEALGHLHQLMTLYPRELSQWLQSRPAAPLLKAWVQGRIVLPARFTGSPEARLWNQWIGQAGVGRPTQRDFAGPEPVCSASPSSRQREPGYWLAEGCYAALGKQLGSAKSVSSNDRLKLAEAEYRLGNYELARNRARALLGAPATDPWAAYWLAKSYSSLAGQCFDKLAALNSDSPRVHEILGRYYSDHQQLSAARREYEAALLLAPDLPDLHLGLGTVYWQGGDWAKAGNQLTRTLELSPASAVAAYELGDCFVQQHKWRQSVGPLEHALAEPAVAGSVKENARLDLAKAKAELGQYAAAIQDLLLLAPSDRDGEVHYRLAMLYRRTGETAKAREALATSEALRKASDQPIHAAATPWD